MATVIKSAHSAQPATTSELIRRSIAALQRVLITGLLLMSVGCATVENPDPFEGMNRKVQSFNDGADRLVLKPLAKGYIKITNKPVRRSVSNFYSNFAYPITIVNQFLQGKVKLGFSDLGRFVVNTTVGLVGLFDPATKMGLEEHDEDFGQTLAVWGFDQGAYFVVPLWGPATTRSGTGDIVSFFVHPSQLIEDETLRFAYFAGWAVQARASLLETEELISGDRYLFIRDAFLQRRQFLADDGVIEEDPFLDDL